MISLEGGKGRRGSHVFFFRPGDVLLEEEEQRVL
jgi:hypothetical protein